MPSIADIRNAIEESDALAIRKLLRDYPELVEATDEYGFTPLMRAASWMERKVDVIGAILDAGANVNRQTSEGYTALHCAIDVNGEANLNASDVIAKLVAAGADLKLRQHYGWTPLLCAVVTGGITEVKSLLAAGADPNETMPFDTLPAFNAGRTTLMGALANPDSEDIVLALLQSGADPFVRDGHDMSFFEYAELVQRESPAGEFVAKVGRCAAIARTWPSGDA